MIAFIREIGYALTDAEHPRRMIRTDPSNPINRPYYFLNAVGRGILRVVGDRRY